VEILVGESVFLHDWCGKAFPLPMPATNFWTKGQLSTKSDAFLSTNILLSLIIFFNLLYSISKIALPRYGRVSHKTTCKYENLVIDSLQTSQFQILSDHFQCPCNAIKTFQAKVPA